MTDRVTINDVAAQASVSKATVSAVLNNKPSVRESTRERVLAAMDELNYKPRGGELRLKGGKRRSIGLIVKEVENPYFADVAHGVRSYASECGYALFVASSEGEHQEEMDLVALFKAQGTAGVILAPTLDDHSDLSYLFDLKRSEYPFVLIGKVPGLQADLVSLDNVDAMKTAVKYLIDQGHTRIIHFAGPAYSTYSKERIEGFRSAFSESYLMFEDDLVVAAGAHMEDGYRRALAYFREHGENLPTAVTCYNDQVALGVFRALHELGIGVPDEVSLIGYDDIDLLKYLPVAFSSVRSPKREVGRKAAELLIRRIEAKKPLSPEKVYLRAELVLRNSSRPILPKPEPNGTAVKPADGQSWTGS